MKSSVRTIMYFFSYSLVGELRKSGQQVIHFISDILDLWTLLLLEVI